MPRVVAVLPALDEEAAIGAVVRGIPAELVDAVVVVDNGSTDRTGECARQAGALVVSELQRGYGAACLTGIGEARRLGAEIVVFLDADGSDPADHLGRLLEPLRHGADLVLGVRDPVLAEPGALTVQQRGGNALATLLMRITVGARYSDLPPFKAVTVAALDRLRLGDRGYGFTIELLLRAHAERLRVIEIGVPCRRRSGGSSKVSGTLRGAFGAGAKILSAIGRHAIHSRARRG